MNSSHIECSLVVILVRIRYSVSFACMKKNTMIRRKFEIQGPIAVSIKGRR